MCSAEREAVESPILNLDAAEEEPLPRSTNRVAEPIAVQVDVRHAAQVNNMVSQAVDVYGRLEKGWRPSTMQALWGLLGKRLAEHDEAGRQAIMDAEFERRLGLCMKALIPGRRWRQKAGRHCPTLRPIAGSGGRCGTQSSRG